MSGRLIVIPTVSPEAAQAHSRFWPSGANFNRSFPGRLDGPPDEVLADFFTTVLFPLVDMIVEMHSGGSGSWIDPCSHMCAVDDPAQRKAMLEAMEAWNSDIHFLYTAGDNYFPTIAQAQGKTIVTTELGGSGLIPRSVHELAWSGLTNVLRHFGVLEGDVVTRASLGLPPARIYDARGADETVTELGSGLMDQTRAPVSGIAEALVMPGETVERGQPIARIWAFDAPSQPPVDVPAERTGLLLGMRARAFVSQARGSRSSASRSPARRCWRSLLPALRAAERRWAREPSRLLHDRLHRAGQADRASRRSRRSRTRPAGRARSSTSRRSRTATGRPCSCSPGTTVTSTRARSPRCGCSRSCSRSRSRAA